MMRPFSRKNPISFPAAMDMCQRMLSRFMEINHFISLTVDSVDNRFQEELLRDQTLDWMTKLF